MVSLPEVQTSKGFHCRCLLESKHWKAFTVDACLSPQPYPAMVSIAEVQTSKGFHCQCLLESSALPSHGKFT
ncbi:hypothetical protein DPMN_018773 [Dreissena polymorpha]|uniref:Uncharacterized protein n=2 Tax=Dreissena polymorpha TaxID=45954 RepID=A0A9D4S7L5_DREPO|nr:hypothetical protein DPMN_018773 [Dreissena polymorpha]